MKKQERGRVFHDRTSEVDTGITDSARRQFVETLGKSILLLSSLSTNAFSGTSEIELVSSQSAMKGNDKSDLEFNKVK